MGRDDPKPARQYKTATERYAYGGALRRFESIKPKGHRINLADDHPALVIGQSLFQARVEHPDDRPRLLIDGHNSRKIGRRVMKGKLRGAPIFTLTLEERATCPRTCAEWRTCYGNSMNWARRIKHGPDFERRLWEELADKQAKHPGGFLVRLHILGDFYSVPYAELWAEALDAYPALHVFGYTARQPGTAIGDVVSGLLGAYPDRWNIRFSGIDGPKHGSIVVDQAGDTDRIVCPAQLGKTDCCATCALCWQSDHTIAFLRH
jgi:hypothetical protein